jgi:hypothetical protein
MVTKKDIFLRTSSHDQLHLSGCVVIMKAEILFAWGLNRFRNQSLFRSPGYLNRFCPLSTT